jgi:hypothetical protein
MVLGVTFILISLCLIDTSTAQQVYEYKNGAGRVVQSLSPPPGTQQNNRSKSSNERSAEEFCRDKWGHDFEMLEFCTKNQVKAKMKQYSYPEDILQFCRQKWHEDQEMIEHCAKNQYAAKRRMGK